MGMSVVWTITVCAGHYKVLTICRTVVQARKLGPTYSGYGTKITLAVVLDDGQNRTGWTPCGAQLPLKGLARQYPGVPVLDTNWETTGGQIVNDQP